MSPVRVLLPLAIAIVACMVGAATVSARGIPGRYIVVLKASAADPGAVAADHAKRDGADVDHVFRHALRGYSARIPDARIDAVRNDPRVDFVTEDFEVHATDTVAANETIPTGILREGAAAGTTVGHAATSSVAVIDTGIDLSHPDLNAVAGKNCVSSSAPPIDDNGHGSHVSGSIAARNQGAGVVGAAPGTKLYAVKVLNAAGSGTGSQVICGIDWVAANAQALNIKVANMSLGGGGLPLGSCGSTTDAEHVAICNATSKGVTFVVAAGNSGWNYDYAPQPDVPAAYPEVLTVTAMSDSDGQPGAFGGAPTCRRGEADDRYASFSNYAAGSTAVNHTIAGPGVCIYSTWMNGGYNTISGTSMATPNVAGLVAACLDDTSASGCARKAPAQVIAQMRANAQVHANSSNGFTGDPLHALSGRYYGYLAWGGVTTPPSSGDFSLSSSPSALTVARGSRGTSTISVTPSGGFTGTVSLSASCPPKVSCSLSPTTVDGSGDSTLTISPNRKATRGPYTITVTGASSPLQHTTTISLTIS